MRAIERGVGGQSFQLGEAVPHHRRIAFKDAPAPQRKDRIADKGRAIAFSMKGDMAERVAGHIDDSRGDIAEGHRVAGCDGAVDAGDFVGFVFRAGNGAAGLLFDGEIAACMVWMPMRVPDLGDGPALGGGLFEVFISVGRVDRGGLATGRIVN